MVSFFFDGKTNVEMSPRKMYRLSNRRWHLPTDHGFPDGRVLPSTAVGFVSGRSPNVWKAWGSCKKATGSTTNSAIDALYLHIHNV